MSTRKRVIIYCLIGLYSVAPILCASIAEGVASATGCRLDETSLHPCVVLGVDVGGLLNMMMLCGWFMIVTVPTGLLAMLVFTLVSLAWKHKATSMPPQPTNKAYHLALVLAFLPCFLWPPLTPRLGELLGLHISFFIFVFSLIPMVAASAILYPSYGREKRRSERACGALLTGATLFGCACLLWMVLPRGLLRCL